MSAPLLESQLDVAQRKKVRNSPFLVILSLAVFMSVADLALSPAGKKHVPHLYDMVSELGVGGLATGTKKKRIYSGHMRGHRAMGYGRRGRHRRNGRGGAGMAGGQHHMRMRMDKYYPGYFGKFGPKRYHIRKRECNVIQVDMLWNLIRQELGKTPEEVKAELVAMGETDKAVVLNTKDFNFHRIEGQGMLPNDAPPLVVKCVDLTKEAEDKIKESGGSVVLLAG